MLWFSDLFTNIICKIYVKVKQRIWGWSCVEEHQLGICEVLGSTAPKTGKTKLSPKLLHSFLLMWIFQFGSGGMKS